METIDLGKILKTKNPHLAKWVPRFVVAGVESLVRLKHINYVLKTFGDLPPMEFIDSTLRYIGVEYTVHGDENIPTDERLIFASNHPLGGLDGLILALGLHPYCPNGEKFIVNDILMNLRPLASLFVPVNKHGRQGSDYARIHEQMYCGDDQVITFPAGLCSRLIGGRVQDTPWKATFAQKAIGSKRRVVPVFIDGANSSSFYRLALWRKKLGVKANIEMLFLPKEMFDQRGKHIHIYIGAPVKIDDSYSSAEWARIIRQKSYDLDPRKK